MVFSYLIHTLHSQHAVSIDSAHLGFWIFIGFLIVILTLQCVKLISDTPFFKFRSSINSLFVSNPINESRSFTCREADKTVIQPPLNPQKTSDYFGLCADSNVILISLESVASNYLKPYNPKGLEFRYFNQLAKTSWVSDYHICLSPNTNTSYFTLYQGNYFQTPADHTNHLDILKNNDFSPLYLTTCPTNKNPKFMKSMGMDSVYFEDNEGLSDKMIFSNLLTQVSKEHSDKNKLFLHLTNMQTHHPYTPLNEHQASDPFERYCLAVEEVDGMLPELMDEISELIDLDNTIIVYTADHGQSFGEMHYSIHSNSIIQPQINVPFLIYHPKLTSRKIAFSSHFDLMPTLYDLLGIRHSEQFIGNSIGLDHIPFSHVLFSETRCGNLPSCFGHINKQRKILIDASLETNVLLNLSDQETGSLSGKEQNYQKQLLRRALYQRGLINRPTDPLKWNNNCKH